MREERRRQMRPLRQVQPRIEVGAVMAGESQAFGGHGRSPLVTRPQTRHGAPQLHPSGAVCHGKVRLKRNSSV